MNSSHLDKKVVGMNRVSEAGPVDCFWPVIFVPGCNLRCPYCLNASIVEPLNEMQFIPVQKILDNLTVWEADGVMISGGEPCILPELLDIINLVHSNGIKVGISTNGTFPDILRYVLNSKLISFVALDCKFTPSDVVNPDFMMKTNLVGGLSSMIDNVAQSLGILWRWHEMTQEALSEVRTTLYPPLVGKGDIMAIGRQIHPNSRWVLQQYRKNTKFNGENNEVEPYSAEEAKDLLNLAKEHCSVRVDMRWP